jgi:hypothetical protein
MMGNNCKTQSIYSQPYGLKCDSWPPDELWKPVDGEENRCAQIFISCDSNDGSYEKRKKRCDNSAKKPYLCNYHYFQLLMFNPTEDGHYNS